MSAIPTEPAASGKLDARARDFVARFLGLLHGDAWKLDDAVPLHEMLDLLAAEADDLGDAELAEAAITLSVYLCSFMEEGRRPDHAQRSHMERLAQALVGDDDDAFAELAAEVRGGAEPAAEAPPPVLSLLLVSDDEDLMADLSLRLGSADISVRARRDVEDLAQRELETVPDAILVDTDALKEIARIARLATGEASGPFRRPLLFALSRGEDLAQRMFALRAGADDVLPWALGAENLAERLVGAMHPGRIEPYRVLIVDDDRAQTLFCDAVLRSQNLDTHICHEPLEALSAIAAFEPEVVLLDLYMPEIDGIELARRIRELPGAEFLSIVFLSGENQPDMRFDVLAAGGDDYFVKPIQPRHLITGVVGRARRARALRERFSAKG